MKTIRDFPFSTLSVAFFLGSVVFYFLLPDFRMTASYLLAFSQIFVFIAGIFETKRLILWMYILTYTTSIVTGALLDVYYQSYYFVLGAFVFWNSSFMLRHIFFSYWGQLKYRWIEFLTWLLGTFFAILSLYFNESGKSLMDFVPVFLVGLVYFVVNSMMYYFQYLKVEKYYFTQKVKVGDQVPYFQLFDQNGKIVDIYADYIKKQKPFVLVFIQGDWCPLCYVLLRSFEKKWTLFFERGVEILSISPDSVEHNKYTKELLNLHYRLLHDPGLETAKLFGFYTPNNNPMAKTVGKLENGVPLMGVVVVNHEGKIIYLSDPDDPQSFNPDKILRIIEKMIPITNIYPKTIKKEILPL